MVRFLARRFAALLVTLLAVSFLVFAVSEATPGKVARKILGPYATAEQVELLTEQMGFNQPLPVRYAEWLGNTLTGDLGQSLVFKQPVNGLVWERLGNTALLAAIAFAVSVPLSVTLGILAGMREGSRLDRTISVGGIVATSIPEFASGVILASIFVLWLGILPGASTLTISGGWSIAQQLVLPVAVMVLYDLGYVARIVRTSMAEVMGRPYIRTAILKGMPFRTVVLRHALRNAMIAPFTVILLQINYLITSAVVVEALFAYPGFGRMMLEAALSQDIAVLEAGALIAVTIAVTTQILGDLGYMALNPRLRVG